MRVLYFDVLCGAAGDMLLASLIDMGFPVEELEKQLAKLPVEKIGLVVEKVSRSGIRCTRITPKLGHSHVHRHLHDLLELFRAAGVSEAVYGRCEAVLNRLADAEAKVHGIPREQVHFHEVGALDTIVDILGVCMAIDYFKVDTIRFSTLTDGYGTIQSAHGVMPVPVPATAVMIEGFRHATLQIPTELLTPTGAALLTALGEQLPDNWNGTVCATGYGCGSKEFSEHPNFIRAILLETGSGTGMQTFDTVLLLESDMDHVSGEIMGDVAGVLLESGALDVSWLPLYMKKGRPGYRLSVMTRVEDGTAITGLIMRHTRTLGVRVQRIERVTADRRTTAVEFEGTSCSAKECSFNGITFTKPEYEALAKIARNKGIPVLDLMDAFVRQQGK
ncbi:MAG: nickel pincer cofactor biosynthesis protein LarC [Chitinispirillaceae bacterium]|nr:nickel pincer cofactor biosynthesis protein LarC [Chitinispirillaceae bacterium]